MTGKTYSARQITNTERLLNMISGLPSERQPEIIRMLEAMILGADMANRIDTAAAQERRTESGSYEALAAFD